MLGRARTVARLDGGLPLRTFRPRRAGRGLFGSLGRVLNRLLLGVLVLALLFAALVAYDGTEPPVSTLMVVRRLSGGSVDRRWTPLAQVSPHLVDAVVMSEDGQFCQHDGVDWHQLHEVLDDPDGPQRGASTITMQVARNLFLWNGRFLGFVRKGMEIPLALLLDAVWSKKRVLEIYLNIAEWGDGIYGAEAAARHDFGKPSADLTPREASLLATALPNPFLRHPARPTRGYREVASVNMVRARDAAEWTGCLR